MIDPSLSVDMASEASEDVVLAVAMLRRGGVVAFPTETVYGLGADALNPDAVRRVFSIKQRPADHPLIVHLASAAQLNDWGRDIPPLAFTLAERFWPGPLTLILKRAEQVSDLVTGGQNSVGLRVPDHPLALELLSRFGGGLVGPSANRYGRISPTEPQHVRSELGDAADMIVDGGPCRVGLESTIVSLLAEQPVILRPGAISRDALEAATGLSFAVNAAYDPALRVPGALAAHYAPRTALRVVESCRFFDEISALLAFGAHVGVIEREGAAGKVPYMERGVHRFSLPGDPENFARRLYAVLRQADEARLDTLLIEAVPDDPAWLAVNDRLRRAAQK